MAKTIDEETPEFRCGWKTAVLAARHWREGKAKQTLILARRSRFPKALERDTEVHTLSADTMTTMTPEDP